ncbi:hypothetical protein V6U90_22375 [Micromonospora sp. CPCC 206060]|uniref:hypothetical protein n=1 Tax=Micromonospora sp. CPCC 206060 TaxID=3122406 RepID=UPI002FF20475
MSSKKRAAGFALALTGAMAATLAPASAAFAAPEIGALGCSSGSSIYACYTGYSGAVDPVSIRWYVNDVHSVQNDNLPSMSVLCTPGTSATIKVVVSDASGSDTASTTHLCRTRWW